MHDEQDPSGVTWLTLEELATRWKVCKRTIRRIDGHDLPYFLINRMRRYDLKDVVRYEHSRWAGTVNPPETDKEN